MGDVIMSFLNDLTKVVNGVCSSVSSKIKKFQNRSHFEAVIAAAVWTAAADGSIDKDEIVKLNKVISVNDTLAVFQDDIAELVSNHFDRFNIGYEIGKAAAVKAIKSCVNDDREVIGEIMATVITIAKADGVVTESEVNVLGEIARLLRVNLSDYYKEK